MHCIYRTDHSVQKAILYTFVLFQEMYLAAKHGQLGKIKQYLEKDRDKNACDEESCNLLACTNIANCLEVVHFLHCNVTDKLVWGHASHACCQDRTRGGGGGATRVPTPSEH
ncbi:hypothetical protein E2C01_078670 [Portunus trituberculatus]|uniref:Uncharacterized protein n=1 Tax=Portunus trituberculatus TaxID=210409 RepID=A0A5B7IQU5_PORTR|nr:hypothetical protein [Portunus trituberculatus]